MGYIQKLLTFPIISFNAFSNSQSIELQLCFFQHTCMYFPKMTKKTFEEYLLGCLMVGGSFFVELQVPEDEQQTFLIKSLRGKTFTVTHFLLDAFRSNCHWDAFCKKRLFKILAKFTRKYLCRSLSFKKVAGFQNRHFPGNFAKFLEAPVLQNIWEQRLPLLRDFFCNLLCRRFLETFSVSVLKISVTIRSSHRRCSIKKPVLKNFAILTVEYLCWSLFLTKSQAFRSTTL